MSKDLKLKKPNKKTLEIIKLAQKKVKEARIKELAKKMGFENICISDKFTLEQKILLLKLIKDL